MTKGIGGFCYTHNRFHSIGCPNCESDDKKIQEVEDALDGNEIFNWQFGKLVNDILKKYGV